MATIENEVIRPKKRGYGIKPDFPNVDPITPLPGNLHGIIGVSSVPHASYQNKGFLPCVYDNSIIPYSQQCKFTEAGVLNEFGQAWDSIPFGEFPARAQQLADSNIGRNPYRLHTMSTDEGDANQALGWPGIIPFLGGNHPAASYHMHRAFGIAAQANGGIYGGNYGGLVYVNNNAWSNPDQYGAGLTNPATGLSELQTTLRHRQETFWLNNDLHTKMACLVNAYVGPGVTGGAGQGFLACAITNMLYAIQGRTAKGGNFPIILFMWPTQSEFDQYTHRHIVPMGGDATIINYTFPTAPPNLTYSLSLFGAAMVEITMAWNDGIWRGNDTNYPADDYIESGFQRRRLENGTAFQQNNRLPLSRNHDGGSPRAYFESPYGYDDVHYEGVRAASLCGQWAGARTFRSAATRQVGSGSILAAGNTQIIGAKGSGLGYALAVGTGNREGVILHNFSTNSKEIEVQLFGSNRWTVVQAAPETSYAVLCGS